jgi:thiamine biosynthesis protein ThiS
MDQALTIVVNGESRQAVPGVSVSELLVSLGLNSGRVALERNFEILPRAAWSDTQVQSGDRYEIVQFVGGG